MNLPRYCLQRQGRTLRPHLEHLERRDCLSCTVFQRGETLVIFGDREANQIGLVSTPEGEITVTCDRGEAQRFVGVERIVIETFAGDDDVTATLACPADPNFHFRVDLGAGDDRLSISGFDPQPDPPIRLISFDIFAGAGNDQVTAAVSCPSDHYHFRANLGAGDDRLNIQWSISGFDPQPDPPIRLISFDILAGAGNDEVTAAVSCPSDHYHFRANLGAGDDRLNIQWQNPPDPVRPGESNPSDPVWEGAFDILAGAGDDVIELSMTDLVIEGVFNLSILGGAGHDILDSSIQPCVLPAGRARLLFDGEASNDRIATRVEVDEDSRGELTARVLGGWGDDDLTLAVHGVDDSSLLTALVDGGRGRDIARVTRNVRVANCERVLFLHQSSSTTDRPVVAFI